LLALRCAGRTERRQEQQQRRCEPKPCPGGNAHDGPPSGGAGRRRPFAGSAHHSRHLHSKFFFEIILGIQLLSTTSTAARRAMLREVRVMQIGVFDHLDHGGVLLHDYYETRFKLIEAFERAGFYSYHVAEHHFTPLGMAPSPSVYLAAVAQRTRRLRFGPLVYALPLYHPLRLIQEICMLDQISGGRLDIGFGRGASAIEASYYERQASQEIYAEGLELVLAGLRSQTLTFEGK